MITLQANFVTYSLLQKIKEKNIDTYEVKILQNFMILKIIKFNRYKILKKKNYTFIF